MIQRTNISISHSHLAAEEECPRKGLIAYRLGWRRPRRDTQYRRGAIGHRLMQEVLGKGPHASHVFLAHGEDRPVDFAKIIDPLHEREGWTDINETYAEASIAAYACRLLLDAMGWMDLATDDEGPMVERKITAPIDALLSLHGIDGHAAEVLRRHCINGQAKCDALIQAPNGLEMIDWKFKRDKWNNYAARDVEIPDPQCCWYWAVLKCAGYDVRTVAQVLVHADRPDPPIPAAELPRNKPTKDQERHGEPGFPSLSHGYTTAENFLAALGRPLETLPEGTKSKPIRAKYIAHVDALRQGERRRAEEETQKVLILPRRIVPAVAIAINRERLLMLARHLDQGIAHRNLRVYNGSPCTGWRCEVREACLSSIVNPLSDAIAACASQGDHPYINVYEEKKT